jgi:exodeoxyribonuclease VII small subunit
MSKNISNNPPSDPLTFEQSLDRLEQIVHALEEGELGLTEALVQYEEGVKLLRQSYELLQRAERRIELLSGVDADGNPITQPFDDTATFDVGQVGNLPYNQAEPGKRRSRRRSATPPDGGGLGMDES